MFVGLEPVTVELTLFTDSLVIRGTVTTPHRRITDILNQADGPFLVLDQVTIEEHGARAQSITVQFAQVNLDAILFATADIPVEPNPSMRAVKTPAQAVVSVPPFRVAGNVDLLVGDGYARTGLRALTESFMPVTDATYWSDQLNAGRRQALLVAVNHRRAQFIAPHQEVDPWAGLGHSRDATGDGAPPAEGQGRAAPEADLEPAKEA